VILVDKYFNISYNIGTVNKTEQTMLEQILKQRFAEQPTQEQREIRMYGCTVAQMRDAVEESLTYRFSGPAMYVISMLSDAQEMTAHDTGGHFDLMIIEDQRQLLNRAKWILSNYCMKQERV
jgi:hypothetical protein